MDKPSLRMTAGASKPYISAVISDSVRRDAKQNDKATLGIRTPDLCFTKAQAESTNHSNNNDLRDDESLRAATYAATSSELATIAETLAKIPNDQRQAVADHLQRLVDLSPAKRAAILMLTSGE